MGRYKMAGVGKKKSVQNFHGIGGAANVRNFPRAGRVSLSLPSSDADTTEPDERG